MPGDAPNQSKAGTTSHPSSTGGIAPDASNEAEVRARRARMQMLARSARPHSKVEPRAVEADAKEFWSRRRTFGLAIVVLALLILIGGIAAAMAMMMRGASG